MENFKKIIGRKKKEKILYSIFMIGFFICLFIPLVICILCTVIARIIAYIFGRITNISTFNTVEAQDLLFIAQNTSLKVKDLLFAGILISSLGAIMDTTMLITSSILK